MRAFVLALLFRCVVDAPLAVTAAATEAPAETGWLVNGLEHGHRLSGLYDLSNIIPGSGNGGKPIYKKQYGERPEYLYYSERYNLWIIGSDYRRHFGKLRGHGAEPHDVTVWEQFSHPGGWQQDPNITVVAWSVKTDTGWLVNGFPGKDEFDGLYVRFDIIPSSGKDAETIYMKGVRPPAYLFSWEGYNLWIIGHDYTRHFGLGRGHGADPGKVAAWEQHVPSGGWQQDLGISVVAWSPEGWSEAGPAEAAGRPADRQSRLIPLLGPAEGKQTTSSPAEGKQTASSFPIYTAFLLQGVEYALLISRGDLRSQFEATMKSALASQQDFSEDDVSIKLSSGSGGSVMVTSEIHVPVGTTSTELMSKLRDSRSTTAHLVGQRVMNTPSLSPIRQGSITIHICGEANRKSLVWLSCTVRPPPGSKKPGGAGSMPSNEGDAQSMGQVDAVKSLRPLHSLFSYFPSLVEVARRKDSRVTTGVVCLALAIVIVLLAPLTSRAARRSHGGPHEGFAQIEALVKGSGA